MKRSRERVRSLRPRTVLLVAVSLLRFRRRRRTSGHARALLRRADRRGARAARHPRSDVSVHRRRHADRSLTRVAAGPDRRAARGASSRGRRRGNRGGEPGIGHRCWSPRGGRGRRESRLDRRAVVRATRVARARTDALRRAGRERCGRRARGRYRERFTRSDLWRAGRDDRRLDRFSQSSARGRPGPSLRVRPDDRGGDAFRQSGRARRDGRARSRRPGGEVRDRVREA